jgi:hypothetical protein
MLYISGTLVRFPISVPTCHVTDTSNRFFKPQTVRTLGIFQDGGLQHNNPASIAQWERKFIWKNREEPDFALSLGTGTSSVTAGSNSGSISRFYVRLYKSFMRNLDGEDAWKRFLNSVAPTARHRYHRLNIQFPGPEPSLDDAQQIPELKASVSTAVQERNELIVTIVDYMIASMFYFELDSLPVPREGGYMCSGYIFCRLDIPKHSLRRLYDRMIETSSWFLIQGIPIRCVEGVPESLPPFKRRVTFRVDSLTEMIAFSIRGITSCPKMLSGFPTSISDLIANQNLDSPFGTVDHFVVEKPLPTIPLKRETLALQHQDGQVVKRSRIVEPC